MKVEKLKHSWLFSAKKGGLKFVVWSFWFVVWSLGFEILNFEF